MPKARIVAVVAAGAVTALSSAVLAQPEAAAPPPAAAPQAPPAATGATDTTTDTAAVPTESEPAAQPALPPAEPGGVLPPPSPAAAPSIIAPMPGLSLPASPAASEEATNAAQPADAKRTIFADDWWAHTRPIIEIHGYFRTRGELFHNFSLRRRSDPSESLWTPPADTRYTSAAGTWGPALCKSSGDANATEANSGCDNRTQTSANLRFRLNPELHVSDNLRVLSQIDILDNLVLGSTPGGYANTPSATGGYSVVTRSGYNPLGFFDDTTETPSAGVNSTKDSVRVKRAWAEYSTPVGQLRFGRMPDHFGLGMYHNSGDGPDDDYQTTIDRLMFITNIRPLDLYVGATWDFPNEGATSESLQLPGAQAYDLAQLDDVDQWSLILVRQKNAQLQKAALTGGSVVVNGGAYINYRTQTLAADRSGSCDANADSAAAAVNCPSWSVSTGMVRRGAWAVTPDLWLQLLYKQFRFEMEAVTVQGKLENASTDANDYTSAPGGAGWRLNAWGIAAQIQQKLLEDRLDLNFGFGWASGDPDVDKTNRTTSSLGETGDLGLTPGMNGLQEQRGDHTMSTFRFHPSYNVDLILHRNLLTRVQGTYYFRPGIAYDFMRKPNGQRLGGSFAGIWTRASEYIQAPGHERDLGIELNGSLYFQSKDGVLNDRPGTLGGFFTKLEYGILFPLGGLGYPSEVDRTLKRSIRSSATDISNAQILRLYLGVFF